MYFIYEHALIEVIVHFAFFPVVLVRCFCLLLFCIMSRTVAPKPWLIWAASLLTTFFSIVHWMGYIFCRFVVYSSQTFTCHLDMVERHPFCKHFYEILIRCVWPAALSLWFLADELDRQWTCPSAWKMVLEEWNDLPTRPRATPRLPLVLASVPFNSFPLTMLTLRFSNGSALCKMKMALPFQHVQRWINSRPTHWKVWVEKNVSRLAVGKNCMIIQSSSRR